MIEPTVQPKILYLQGAAMLAALLGPLASPGVFCWALTLNTLSKGTAFALGMTGLMLVLGSARALGRSFTAHAEPKQNGFLILQWPYTWIRNPMYTGGLMMNLSWSIWHESRVSLIATLALAVVLVLKVQVEEKFLTQRFGTEYLSYARAVGRFFPGIGKI